MGDKEKERDLWSKADVISKWLIPVAVVILTFVINDEVRENDAKQKTFEVAVAVLQSPESVKVPHVRDWALGVFEKATGVAGSKLPEEAKRELQRGDHLPATYPAGASQSRIRILRLRGAPAEAVQRVLDELRKAGYNIASTSEREPRLFPNSSEVRYYYPTDEAAAVALQAHLLTEHGVVVQVNDRSKDQDAAQHRPGDLHLYLRE